MVNKRLLSLYEKYKHYKNKWVLIAEELGESNPEKIRSRFRYWRRKLNIDNEESKDNEDEEVVFEKTKLTRKELNELTTMVAKHIAENFEVKKLKEPRFSPKWSKLKKKEEISILDISDVHLGMVNKVFDGKIGKEVETYNYGVFEKELYNLQQAIIEIHQLLSHAYRLRKLVVFMLGDILTNDRQFEGQVFSIEECVGKQIETGISYFSMFFNNLLRIYETIEVVGVCGNHGKSRSLKSNQFEEPVENNFEYYLYKALERQFSDSKRIKVIVPSTKFYIHKILNWRHFLTHGDILRGSTETYIKKQIKELYINVGGFDVFHYGHFHKSTLSDELSDKVLIKRIGCWIEKDNYGFKMYKEYSRPQQLFFGCNKNRPETWSYIIDLRG